MRYALILLVALIGHGQTRIEAKELTPREIYEQASPAVVMVMGRSDSGEGGSGGIGSIIHMDGVVLTNAHVVIDEKREALSAPFSILEASPSER